MSLIAELKRRNVFRVGVAYAIVAWLLIEVASVIFPGLHLPDWTLTFLIVLVVAGFPLAMIFAWAFELTPEGIKLEKTVDPAESTRHLAGRKLDFAIIGLLAIALIFVAVDNYILEAGPEQAPVAREKSIAVLPFANISPDPEDAYFADGIHDEILAQLSKIRDLKVISRTSVMQYRLEDRPSLPEIAAELGVANILEGSVRLAGNQVRITTQLIEAESDAHFWTETYDRELTAANIFSIQSDVATAVAEALQAALSPAEQERIATVPTTNLAAYQAYLLGVQRLDEETVETLAEAIDYFQRAIALDADFALAYAGLAWTYIQQRYYSGLPPDEMLAKAQAATNKALELDDRLGEAHTALGMIKRSRNEFAAAEAAFRRGLELSPNSSRSHLEFGIFLRDSAVGRYEEALSSLEKALELDPLSVSTTLWMGAILNRLGRFDESLVWFEKVLEIDPDNAGGFSEIGFHHWLVSGQLDEAVVWITKAVALDPEHLRTLCLLGIFLLDLGDPDQAENWIMRGIDLGPENVYANTTAMYLHLYRGAEAAAARAARKAYAVNPFFGGVLPVLRDQEVRAGRFAEARALYREHFPELLYESKPKIGRRNYRAAVDLALILSRTGEQERADLLLDRSLQQIQGMPRLGEAGYWIADVQIYALRGEKQKALSSLRQAIDEGWRSIWWYELKLKPDLELLHDEPEYQAMIAEIEADMAAQLARVRAMERNGELEPIPELVAE
jgi:TolB-like protein/Flp pilus assembly protein TadD